MAFKTADWFLGQHSCLFSPNHCMRAHHLRLRVALLSLWQCGQSETTQPSTEASLWCSAYRGQRKCRWSSPGKTDWLIDWGVWRKSRKTVLCSLFVRLGQSNKPPHGVCSFDCVDENNDLDPFPHLNNGVFLPKEFAFLFLAVRNRAVICCHVFFGRDIEGKRCIA